MLAGPNKQTMTMQSKGLAQTHGQPGWLHTVVSGTGAAGAAEGSEKMEKVRPIDVHKLCLVCRRRYSMEAERCDCGGRLYVYG